MKKKLVIGVSGASGSLYIVHLLQALVRYCEGTSHLIISPSALRVYREEYESKVESPQDFLDEILAKEKLSQSLHHFELEDYQDIGARPASGSYPVDAMLIVPCSMKTISAIANGYTSNLIERAADVSLKERRPLILVPREAPYGQIHLENMLRISQAGGVILSASPAFYQKPKSIDDLGRFIAGRILGTLKIEHELFSSWDGGKS